MMPLKHLILMTTLLFVSNVLAQSSNISLDTAYAFDTFVIGSSSQIKGRIIVYDISYPARTKLGEGIVDKNQRFAFSIHPPLQQGHKLVAEDETQTISSEITIQPPRKGPVNVQSK